MFFKRLLTAFIFVILFSGIGLSQTGSFLLKETYYSQSVFINNPETSPLAETFLRNGIKVTSSPPYFSFKTEDSGDTFTVYIYYLNSRHASNDFVGRFVYNKKGVSEETRDFVNAFVSWMVQNAWPKRR